MINITRPTQTNPPVITEVRRDDYSIGFVLRHRRNWRKMTPEQRSVVLLASADQLETYAEQMRNEANDQTRR